MQSFPKRELSTHQVIVDWVELLECQLLAGLAELGLVEVVQELPEMKAHGSNLG